MNYSEEKKYYLGDKDELTAREKAAILMVALGEDAAGDVMKYLADFEIEDLTHIITELKSLPNDVQDRVLEEFEQHLLAGEWVNQGGVDFARTALERAVGPRPGDSQQSHFTQFVRFSRAEERSARTAGALNIQRASPDGRTHPIPTRSRTSSRHAQSHVRERAS